MFLALACPRALPAEVLFNPFAGAPGGSVRRTVLPNGAVLLVLEDPTSPVVALNVWVGAGSVDEAPEERGMAHLIEHMLFKGTKKRGVGEISREVEAAGGYLNAFTGYEYTCFYVVLPADRLETALDVLFDAYLHPTFDAAELEKEKEVVFEEMRMRRDDPWSWSWELLFRTVFEKGPYRHPVIGDRDILAKVPRESLQAYFKRHYIPKKTVLSVVGAVDPEKVRRWVERRYGSVSAPSPKPSSFPREPEPKALRVHAEAGKVSRIYVSLGFPTVPLEHPDTPALEVLSSVLGDGASSRLSLAVREGTRSADEVSAYTFSGDHGGLLAVQGVTDADRLERFLADAAAELGKVIRHGADAAELAKVKTRVRASKVFEKESVDGQAKNLGWWELRGHYRLEERYLSALEAVTSEDLKRVAARYLEPRRGSLVLYHPEDVKVSGDAQKWARTLREGFAQGERAGAADGEGVLRRWDLPHGGVLWVKERRAVPLAAVGVYFRGGFPEEEGRRAGITSLMTRCLLKGTERRDHAAFARVAEGIGARVETTLEKDYWGVTLDVLTERLDAGIDLLEEVLTTPRLDPAEVEKERALQLSEIARLKDDPAEYALFQADLVAFAGTPYGHPPLGTEETLKGLDAKAVRNWHQKTAAARRLTVVAVGDVNAEALRERFSRLAERLPVGRAYTPPRRKPHAVPSREDRHVLGRHQASVVLSLRAPAFEARDYFTLRVVNALLNGMGARLFVELRDKRSLAYSVYAGHEALAAAGAYQVYLGCAPEKVEEARRGMVEVLTSLAEGEVPAGELERAKNYVTGLYQVGLQSNRNQRSTYARFELSGPGAPWMDRYPERVRDVGAEEVRRAAKRVLAAPARSWVVVVPKSPPEEGK